MTEKLKFVLGSAENSLGKGGNAGYQHFFLFTQCFQRLFFQGHEKSGLCAKGLMDFMDLYLVVYHIQSIFHVF